MAVVCEDVRHAHAQFKGMTNRDQEKQIHTRTHACGLPTRSPPLCVSTLMWFSSGTTSVVVRSGRSKYAFARRNSALRSATFSHTCAME